MMQSIDIFGETDRLRAEIEQLRDDVANRIIVTKGYSDELERLRAVLQTIADEPSKAEVSGSMAEDMAASARAALGIYQQSMSGSKT